MIIKGNYTYIECEPGKNIDLFFQEVAMFTNANFCKVLANFNDTYVEAKMGETKEELIKKWNKQRGD